MSETTPTPTAAAPPDTAPDDRWELSAQWRRAWRLFKWTAYATATLFALVILSQVYLLANLFGDLHPLAGGLFVGLVTALLGWFVVRPLVGFLRMPKVAAPPAVDLRQPDLSRNDLKERVDYDIRYLKNLRRNPSLAAQKADINRAITDAEELLQGGGTVAEGAAKIARFEQERILPLLAELDREIDAYIRKEALGVGTATAVSLNGTIDAFVVLWRNANMISRIARRYYGRPSLALSLEIIGDVAMSVVISRVAEDLTETAGDTLGGLMNRLGGIVAGPIMDGSVNALMTLKLGYAAKRRCRSFEVWSRRRAHEVARDVYAQVKAESGNLIGEMLKIVGGTAGVVTGVAQKAWSAPKSAWSLVQNTVARRTGPKTGQEVP